MRPERPSPNHRWVTIRAVYDKDWNLLEEEGYWYDGPWALAVAMNTQTANAYRFYDDSGDEAGSAAIAAQDTTATASVATSTAIQLRWRVEETGNVDGSSMDDYTLDYSKNGGADTAVPTTDSGDGILAAAAGLTNQANTTNRASEPITDGSGSFVTGKQSTDGQVDDVLITALNFTELVYGLQFNATNLVDGDEFSFVLRGTGIDSSNRAHIEIFIAAGPGVIDADGLLGTKNLEGFAPTVELFNEYKPQLGTMNLESGHDSLPVTYVYTINPTRGEINFEGFAPTVTLETGATVNVTSLLGEMNLEGFAPTVDIIRTIDGPVTGELNLEGFAATVQSILEPTAEPAFGTLNLEGFAPATEVVFEPTFFGQLGELNLEGFAPQTEVIYEPTFEPAFGALNLEGFAATVEVVFEPTFFPDFGTINAEGFIPTIGAGAEFVAEPDFGTLNLVGFAPAIEITREAAPDFGTLNLEGFAPATEVVFEPTFFGQLGELNLEGFAGTVDFVFEPSFEPAFGTLNLEGFAPTVEIVYEPSFEPDVGILNLEGFAATIEIVFEPTVFGQFGTINAVGFTATATSEGEFAAAPAVGILRLEGFAPEIEIIRTAEPDFGTINAEGFAPTVQTENVVTPQPQLGIVNFDGSIAEVSIERTIRPAKGDLELEGFAGTVTTEKGQVVAFPAVGYIDAVGFAPSATIIGRPAAEAEETQEYGGGGTYPEYDDELEVILMICRKFLEDVA